MHLSNKYIVLDLSELKGKLLPVGMMIALDYVWDKIKSDRTKKKAIMIDEIWQLIGAGSNRMAAEFCLEIFKVIRGFGGAGNFRNAGSVRLLRIGRWALRSGNHQQFQK